MIDGLREKTHDACSRAPWPVGRLVAFENSLCFLLHLFMSLNPLIWLHPLPFGSAVSATTPLSPTTLLSRPLVIDKGPGEGLSLYFFIRHINQSWANKE